MTTHRISMDEVEAIIPLQPTAQGEPHTLVQFKSGYDICSCSLPAPKKREPIITHMFDQGRYPEPIKYSAMVALCGEKFNNNDSKFKPVPETAEFEMVDGVCPKCVQNLLGRLNLALDTLHNVENNANMVRRNVRKSIEKVLAL